MANNYSYYNPNQTYYMQDLQNMRDKIDRQMTQMQNQPQPVQPIQNFINTNQPFNLEFEARFLKEGENVQDIIVNRKTAFIDLINDKLSIKELNGEIKQYEILKPKDEKDIRIEQLERKIREMEGRLSYEQYNEYNKPIEKVSEPSTSSTINDEPRTKRASKQSTKNA